MGDHTLSPKSACVLEMIAEGHAYSQILEQYPALTFHDIFEAADEALRLLHVLESQRKSARGNTAPSAPAKKTLADSIARAVESEDPIRQAWAERLIELRAKRPRAYEPWSDEEDTRLAAFFDAGHSPGAIAERLQRQGSAIRSRLRKLGKIQ